MASKLQFYSALAEHTLGGLTTKRGNWTQFLDSAAWLYKYPFQDQLMIHAQRPDATACAELEFWNEQFNRWVRKGAKGIALIDDSGSYPRLKYVFDVSDTEPSLYRAKPVQLWEMRQEHKTPVLTELARNYEDVSVDDTLAEAFRNIAAQLAHEYYEDNYREILYRTENSFLEPPTHYDFAGTAIEEVDDTALRAAFEETVANSVAYTVMARCGLDPSEYFDEEDFQAVIDFNTPDMANALGVASSNLSEQVLRDVEITIRKYERVKNAERSDQSHDRNIDLHANRGLHDTRLETERASEGTDGAARQVREDEESVPERTSADNVQPPAVERNSVPASEGSGRSGGGADVAGDGRADSEGEPARQGDRPDGVDGADERVESPSGGDGLERTDLQLDETKTPSDEGGVSLSGEPPPDTFSQLGKRSIEAIMSTSAVSLAEVDSILRDGGNFYNHKLSEMPFDSRSTLRIAAHFAKDLGAEDNARFLKREFLSGRHGRDYTESGKGFDFGNHRVCAWYDVDGITLAIGSTAKNNIHRVTIPWEDAAARVDELMREGQYVSRSVFDHALDNERRELADGIWFFYRDDMGEIPEDYQGESGGHPGDVAAIRSLLEDEDARQAVLDRLENDVNEWSYDTEKPRSWHDPYGLLDDMRDAMNPPVILPDDGFEPVKNFSYFITQDEIDAVLTRGGTFNEGKFRFLSFFLNDHDDKEKLDFIKREYGHGGGTWSQTDGWQNAEPGKGLTITRGSLSESKTEANLKWNVVIKRTEQLISEGRYMTRAELDRLPNYERLALVRRVDNFFHNLPDEYERPFHSKTWQNYTNTSREEMERLLDFNYPHEAEWQAIRDFLDNPERVDSVLEQMRHIFENTSTDDRYFDTRKAGFEALSSFRDGTYTLFPGLGNLPDPETAVARRTTDTPMPPRREMVEDLREPSSIGFQASEPQRMEQMTLFDFGGMPALPSVDEQRTRIEQTQEQEAEQQQELREAEVETPALSLSDDADAPFLNIADDDKARIVEQFSANPRSRDAVNLVREVYGDGLGMPLPQAVKRIAELVEDGAFNEINDPYSLFEKVREELSERGFAVSGELVEDGINEYNSRGGKGNAEDVADFIEDEYLTEEPELGLEQESPQAEAAKLDPLQECERIKAENGGAIVMWQVGDFFEMYGEDAKTAAETLNVAMTQRLWSGEPQAGLLTGIPHHSLSSSLRKLNEAGFAVAVASIGAGDERNITLYEAKPPLNQIPYNIGDRFIYNGKPHEIVDITDYVKVQNLGTPAAYPIFDHLSFRKYDFEERLSLGEIVIDPSLAEPEATEPEIPETETVETGKPLYKVGDTVYLEGEKPFVITRISEFNGEVQLQDPSLLYPIFRAESKENFEWLLSIYSGNEQHLAPATPQPAHMDAEDTLTEMEMESVYAEPAEPVELDFDTVARTALERVMADADYAEALAGANSRASLRNPCTWALEQSIRDHQEDEPEVYRRYFSDDDFNDSLFDFVLKQSWEQRPQPITPERAREELYPLVIKARDGELSFSDVEAAASNLRLKSAEYGSNYPDDGRNGDVYAFWNSTGSRHDGSLIWADYNIDTDGNAGKVVNLEIDYNAFGIEPPEPRENELPEGWTEITDPAELAEIEAIFGDDKPKPVYSVGQRVVLDLNERIGVQTSIPNAGEFEVTKVNGDIVGVTIDNGKTGMQRSTITWDLTADEVERFTVHPVAEKLHEELSPSGKDTTAYYLFQYPNGIAPAALAHETLSLIKEKADTYVICADVCYLSESEMANWNIGFRKMPRDWNLLPEAVQEQIHAIRPDYEQQWLDDTKHQRDFDEWNKAREETEQQTIAEVPQPKAENFRITDDHLGEGGAKTKFRANIKALQTLKDIEFEGRNATPEEQETLSRYVGWGGVQQAFDPDNKDWTNEYLELNALLTPEEWQSAKASTLNAHYTSPVVIKAMYETVERLGFQSGNILEPACGVGNFLGLLPDTMRDSKLYGVELDSVTARIAKQLYPNADIQEMGYEKTQYSDAFFDLAIGNVPFGGFGVIDKRYKTNFQIHDYFFQKSLDKVRPGGVIAFVTSKGTLDKQNPEVRKYIAQRAELLGAVRLPNNAFLKNAGTEATTDIIFLQKRDRPLDVEPEWVHLGMTDDGIPVNRYFIDNPEMMLGRMTKGESSRMYGSADTTTCVPFEGADLAQQLRTALSFIQGEYTVDELDDLDGVDNHAIPADPNVKNFSYTEVDGTVYFRENSLMYPVELPSMTLDRIRGMIQLRECVNKLIALQLDEHDDSEITAQQAELNTLYDGFVAEFGLISSTANSRAFNADSAYYLLSSLEVIDEDGELERKADMFSKRTIRQKTIITHVDTATEALAVSLGEKACVDLDYMSELTGFDREKLLGDLQGVVFLNIGSAGSQEKTYVTADEYLSGNVREKLRQAEAAAAADPSYNINVEALKAIQPKDLEAGEIGVRLGATWIAPSYIQDFMYELLDTNYYNKRVYQVQYHNFTGEWQVTGKGRAQYNDIHATVTYGTKRMNAYQILDDTLNLRDVRVYDLKEDADGKERRVLNKKETMLAQQKQELIKQKFRDWLWSDPERRQTLVKQYNELFNSVRPREYDGSHITFSGMNPEIKLSKHQVDGAARQIYGGNTLYAHVVGAGKTFTMIASAMESKRLGLCQKNLFSVPNHLTEQWASEFLRLYPSANILVATKKDFEMRNRKKFCAKIATGDYDAVIIGHTQLEKIPMSRERQERMIREQIWEIEDGIRELKDSNGERFSIKQLEKTKRSLELRLTKLLDSKKRDDVVTFEQLGVDRLYVDEAHNFKNLFLYTKMRNVAGLSTSEAQKSSDLFMKCRYMDELTDNKGVIFATGTPISNSMSEMYTMQRYLQYDTLAAKNLTHFDAWASIFGETVTSIELAPEGTGYRARTRFAKFHNLPELMSIFKEVADIQTADMLKLPVPDAKFENVIVEPSELQQEMVEELSERAARVHARLVEPNVDNMLKITTDGRKIGLDQRLMNPVLPDHEGSKVNACTDNVFRIWEETKSDRLTQLVFCDFSTPNKDGRFNVYDDIRAKLLARGIPESEIAFIHDADTETKKKELFAKVRQGKVRVLFGSTFKMGAGTNVQDRLIAIHDADCPWRPADLEQRSGRIIRQGNKNSEVMIFRYATSGTFDSYLWQTVQKKQEFIAQIMSSKSPVRSCEDVDETALSYAEIKALCAGNPLIAEKMNLDNEVAKLRMLKAEHKSQHYRLEDDLLKRFPEQIKSVTERIAGIEKDITMYAAEKEKCVELQTGLGGAVSASTKFPGMVINGVAHAEKEPASKALLEACKEVKGRNTEYPVGEYMGFKMSLQYESFGQQINLLMRGAMTYKIELGTDALGNITRINNALDKLPERLDGAKSTLENLNKQSEAAKVELSKPFEQEAELAEKEARLALLNADLNIDGDGGMEILNDAESRDSDDFVEQVGQALDEAGVKYTRGYDPDSDADDNDDDFDDVSDEVRPQYGGSFERVPQAVASKSKPSILDGIRTFDSTKHNGVQGKDKPPEHAI